MSDCLCSLSVMVFDVTGSSPAAAFERVFERNGWPPQCATESLIFTITIPLRMRFWDSQRDMPA